MITICEECGTKYRIDPEKLQGKSARFKCKKCGHINPIEGPKTPEKKQINLEIGESEEVKSRAEQESKKEKKEKREKKKSAPGKQRHWFGIQTKIIVFLMVPIILGFAASLLTLRQMKVMTEDFVEDSTRALVDSSRQNVLDVTTGVSLRASLYLSKNPELTTAELASDRRFTDIVNQKVGNEGYTFLFELPASSPGENPLSYVVDAAVRQRIEQDMGAENAAFDDLFSRALEGRAVRGVSVTGLGGELYYAVSIPLVDEPYGVGMLIPEQEFTSLATEMEQVVKDKSAATRNLVMSILAVTFITMFTIVGLFGNRLVKNLEYLTDVADRISIGELETEIKLKSKDEIGGLAQAISRMQDSLRLSIERLRKRK